MTATIAVVSAPTLERLRATPSLLPEYVARASRGDAAPGCLNLDKAWNGLHYLLTGQVEGGREPESLAVLGGQEFGPDVGYGPPRFLTESQVAEVARALAALEPVSLAPRFKPKDMARGGVYPQQLWVPGGSDALAYLLHAYARLREFYRNAAARREAVLQWLA